MRGEREGEREGISRGVPAPVRILRETGETLQTSGSLVLVDSRNPLAKGLLAILSLVICWFWYAVTVVNLVWGKVKVAENVSFFSWQLSRTTTTGWYLCIEWRHTWERELSWWNIRISNWFWVFLQLESNLASYTPCTWWWQTADLLLVSLILSKLRTCWLFQNVPSAGLLGWWWVRAAAWSRGSPPPQTTHSELIWLCEGWDSPDCYLW